MIYEAGSFPPGSLEVAAIGPDGLSHARLAQSQCAFNDGKRAHGK
jgi:hypothetical protein